MGNGKEVGNTECFGRSRAAGTPIPSAGSAIGKATWRTSLVVFTKAGHILNLRSALPLMSL